MASRAFRVGTPRVKSAFATSACEREWRGILQEHGEVLHEKLQLDAHLLLRYCVLDPSEVSQILGLHADNKEGRNELLLRQLEAKTWPHFCRFLSYLSLTRQQSLVKLLRDAEVKINCDAVTQRVSVVFGSGKALVPKSAKSRQRKFVVTPGAVEVQLEGSASGDESDLFRYHLRLSHFFSFVKRHFSDALALIKRQIDQKLLSDSCGELEDFLAEHQISSVDLEESEHVLFGLLSIHRVGLEDIMPELAEPLRLLTFGLTEGVIVGGVSTGPFRLQMLCYDHEGLEKLADAVKQGTVVSRLFQVVDKSEYEERLQIPIELSAVMNQSDYIAAKRSFTHFSQ